MRIAVRVTPNASTDRVEGYGEDAAGRGFLKVRVRSVPEDGKANKAVARTLAKALGLAKSSVQVVTGEKARLKGVDINCAETSDAAQLIKEWMGHER